MNEKLVIVYAQPRNGGTWMMKCIEKMLGKPMLFQPFEGVGRHSDSVKDPPIPEHIVRRGGVLCDEMELWSECQCPEWAEQEFRKFARQYVEFRGDIGGMKVTTNLPSVTRAFMDRELVVIRVMRNIVDACLSTMQHWKESHWIDKRIEGAKKRGYCQWSEASQLDGDERIFAERLLTMAWTRKCVKGWMNGLSLKWLDVSMERASASPAYVAPLIADAIGVNPEKALDVLKCANEPVYSYPPLRDATELKRAEEIARSLHV